MWQRSHKCSSLELRLGPPGEESLNENMKNVNKERDGSESPLTLGYFSTQKISTSHTPGPRGDAVFHHQHNPHQANAKASSFPQHQSSPQNMAVMGKDESQSQPCCVDLQDAEKNAFSPSSALPNRSHKRYSCFSLLYICIFWTFFSMYILLWSMQTLRFYNILDIVCYKPLFSVRIDSEASFTVNFNTISVYLNSHSNPHPQKKSNF